MVEFNNESLASVIDKVNYITLYFHSVFHLFKAIQNRLLYLLFLGHKCWNVACLVVLTASVQPPIVYKASKFELRLNVQPFSEKERESVRTL